jgi:hypothetical protein
MTKKTIGMMAVVFLVGIFFGGCLPSYCLREPVDAGHGWHLVYITYEEGKPVLVNNTKYDLRVEIKCWKKRNETVTQHKFTVFSSPYSSFDTNLLHPPYECRIKSCEKYLQ